MFPLVTPSYAAGLLLAHTLVWKLAMTALFRLTLTDGNVPKAVVDKLAASQKYHRWWAAQKNEARRSSAEHLIATKAPRFTATAWIPHCC